MRVGPLAVVALALAACATAPAPVVVVPRTQVVADDLQLTRLHDDVWLHTTWKDVPGIGPFPANGLVVEGPTGVVLVDAAWTPDQLARLRAWVRDTLGKPVAAVVVTHAHDDRIGGAADAVAAGISVHGLPASVERAPAAGFAPPTDVLAEPGDQVTAGGVTLATLWPGHGHAPDNLVVWHAESRVLFGGCLVKSLGAGGLGYTKDADLVGWAAAMEAVRAQPWRPAVVVPGHGRVGGVELLEHTAHLVAAARPPDRKVAVTIDDLPLATWGVYRDAAHRLDTVGAWCDRLRGLEAPATGFFNLHRKAPKLVELWAGCGIQLGNHTLTHLHPDKVPLKRYLADLRAGHEAVERLVPPGTRIPFRYPYLRRGFDPATRDAIRAELDQLGSYVAPVTIDTQDWWYAIRWSEATRDGASAAADRYLEAWRWNLEEATLHAEAMARAVFGREPPQILLLHANEIGAHHLDGYFAWLRERGYRFVSLDEALADPAYAEPLTHTSPMGDSQWLRLRRERRAATPAE